MLKKKGQNIAEYVILVAIIIGAAAAMQIYIKRAMQGRMADATDFTVNSTFDDGNITWGTKQYEPYYTNTTGTVQSSRNLNELTAIRGQINRTGVSEETQRLTGAYDQSDWVNNTSR